MSSPGRWIGRAPSGTSPARLRAIPGPRRGGADRLVLAVGLALAVELQPLAVAGVVAGLGQARGLLLEADGLGEVAGLGVGGGERVDEARVVRVALDGLAGRLDRAGPVAQLR